MSCHGCASKFSFMKREHSCPSCGFSYCSKCLQFKVQAPGESSTNLKVCKSCMRKSGQSDSIVIEPPEILIKRLEKLENPVKPPIVMVKHEDKYSNLRKGLSVEDQELVSRLEKLKDKVPTPVEDNDIQQRLNRLKGDDYQSAKCSSEYTMPDTRSDSEKSDALMKQYAEETLIDNSREVNISDVEDRLRRLKGVGTKADGDEPMNYDSDEDDETAAANLLKKVLHEVELDKRLKSDIPDFEMEDEEEELENIKSNELPWCVICNEDAVVKCLDCDNDLYCNYCFKEGHNNFDMKGHRTEKYTKSK